VNPVNDLDNKIIIMDYMAAVIIVHKANMFYSYEKLSPTVQLLEQCLLNRYL